MSIELIEVGVRFGGIVALRDVSLTLNQGEILAVIGPNGSGKSTLFNTVSGLVRLAAGRVLLNGRDLAGVPAHQRVVAGIARTFQTPRFDPATTVEEAVLRGFYRVGRVGWASALLRLPNASAEERVLRERCRQILDDLRLGALARHPLGALSMGYVRLVEVARAVANQPKFILLDEPAAGLTQAEQATLADEIHALARGGVGILLVEHNFALVRRLAGHIVVLDRGRELVRGTPGEVASDPRFIAAYLGTSGMVAPEPAAAEAAA